MPFKNQQAEKHGSSLMELLYKDPCLGNNFIIWQLKVSFNTENQGSIQSTAFIADTVGTYG